MLGDIGVDDWDVFVPWAVDMLVSIARTSHIERYLDFCRANFMMVPRVRGFVCSSVLTDEEEYMKELLELHQRSFSRIYDGIEGGCGVVLGLTGKHFFV